MTRRTYHRDPSLPEGAGWVFVFGSNRLGVHGKGAAAVARRLFGAAPGVAEGRTGDAYAIPTKAHWRADGLPLVEILGHVAGFIAYATAHQDVRFFVTRVGCGLAGHRDQDIAPMFRRAPANCSLPDVWRPFIESEAGAVRRDWNRPGYDVVGCGCDSTAPAADTFTTVLEHPWRAEDCGVPSPTTT